MLAPNRGRFSRRDDTFCSSNFENLLKFQQKHHLHQHHHQTTEMNFPAVMHKFAFIFLGDDSLILAILFCKLFDYF